jgi:hypothetical protein
MNQKNELKTKLSKRIIYTSFLFFEEYILDS